MKENMEKKNTDNSPAEKEKSRKHTSRQIVAMAGVILLVLLYVITLITAIADTSASATWFRLSLFATFALPLVIWIYSWMYGRLTGKPAAGDPERPDTAPQEAPLDKKK